MFRKQKYVPKKLVWINSDTIPHRVPSVWGHFISSRRTSVAKVPPEIVPFISFITSERRHEERLLEEKTQDSCFMLKYFKYLFLKSTCLYIYTYVKGFKKACLGDPWLSRRGYVVKHIPLLKTFLVKPDINKLPEVPTLYPLLRARPQKKTRRSLCWADLLLPLPPQQIRFLSSRRLPTESSAQTRSCHSLDLSHASGAEEVTNKTTALTHQVSVM